VDTLKAEAYFDFDEHPFAHRALFDDTPDVLAAIRGIVPYCEHYLDSLEPENELGCTEHIDDVPNAHCSGRFRVILCRGATFSPCCIIGASAPGPVPTIHVAHGAHLVGCTVDLRHGDIEVGVNVDVQPFSAVHGPCILGERTRILQGALLRAGVITGRDACIRCEAKNSLFMDHAEFPHPGYLGDSLCGYRSHFGNQATAANLPLIGSGNKNTTIKIRLGDEPFDTGMRKLGIVMGDGTQVGCGAVTDPGTFLRPCTLVYPLARVSKGFYGPNELIKNKPMAHGVVERTPLR